MIRNFSKNITLSEKEYYAVDFFSRFRGLIGQDFSRFDGMIFPECGAVHTCFMKMKIDIVFLDESWKVVEVFPEVSPWKLCLHASGASVTVELPAGTIFRTKTEKGDMLRLENE